MTETVSSDRWTEKVNGWIAEAKDDGVENVAHYVECRIKGTSHKLAAMFADGVTPALMTDAVFLQGRGGCYSQFQEHDGPGSYYKHIAKQTGTDITGKVYLSGLAAYPGDPRAWVSGRGDVQKVCEERGWDCDGAVKVKASRFTERPTVEVAEDIVQDEIVKTLLDHPEPKSVNVPDLREKIVNKRKPKWKK